MWLPADISWCFVFNGFLFNELKKMKCFNHSNWLHLAPTLQYQPTDDDSIYQGADIHGASENQIRVVSIQPWGQQKWGKMFAGTFGGGWLIHPPSYTASSSSERDDWHGCFVVHGVRYTRYNTHCRILKKLLKSINYVSVCFWSQFWDSISFNLHGLMLSQVCQVSSKSMIVSSQNRAQGHVMPVRIPNSKRV